MRAAQEEAGKAIEAGLPKSAGVGILPPPALVPDVELEGGCSVGLCLMWVTSSLTGSQSSFACSLVVRQGIMYPRLASR